MTKKATHIVATEDTVNGLQREINSKAGMLLIEALPLRRASIESILAADIQRFTALADDLVVLRSLLADSKLQLDALRGRSG